jgi:hypothetical protein
MSDETVIRKAVEAIKRQEPRPEREKLNLTVLDLVKFLPIIALTISAAMGYQDLRSNSKHMQKQLDAVQVDNSEQWKAIRK